jgi:hypothetical protein
MHLQTAETAQVFPIPGSPPIRNWFEFNGVALVPCGAYISLWRALINEEDGFTQKEETKD